MKTEVKLAIIGGAVTVIVSIVTGFFGYLNSKKPETASAKPAATAPPAQPAPAATAAKPATTPPSITVQGNGGEVTIISGDHNIKAGRNVTIQNAGK